MFAYVASYPRSGNSWVRYLVEECTGRPTLGCRGNRENDPPLHKDMDGDPVARKFHDYDSEFTAGRQPSEDDALVLVLRNYKECIVRHAGARDPEKSQSEFDAYAELLDRFDEWSGPKTVIYYENLICEDVVVSLRKLSGVFGFDEDQTEDIMNSLSKRREKSINAYAGRSHTCGKNSVHHSSKLSEDQKLAFDEAVKSRVSESLFARHLEQYIESR